MVVVGMWWMGCGEAWWGMVSRGGAVVGYGLWVLFGCCVCVCVLFFWHGIGVVLMASIWRFLWPMSGGLCVSVFSFFFFGCCWWVWWLF